MTNALPYLLGIAAFVATYMLFMFLTGPFASMIIAPIFGLVAAVVVFVVTYNFLEKVECSND